MPKGTFSLVSTDLFLQVKPFKAETDNITFVASVAPATTVYMRSIIQASFNLFKIIHNLKIPRPRSVRMSLLILVCADSKRHKVVFLWKDVVLIGQRLNPDLSDDTFHKVGYNVRKGRVTLFYCDVPTLISNLESEQIQNQILQNDTLMSLV